MRLGAPRFVPGETLDECVAGLRALKGKGLHVNTTLLGEGVLEPAQSTTVVDAYVASVFSKGRALRHFCVDHKSRHAYG